MRSTFKLLFYINRNKVKSDGTTAVLCRISIDGKKSAVTTGVYCKPGDWDSKKCEIKTARENNRVREPVEEPGSGHGRTAQDHRVRRQFRTGIPPAGRRGGTRTAQGPLQGDQLHFHLPPVEDHPAQPQAVHRIPRDEGHRLFGHHRGVRRIVQGLSQEGAGTQERTREPLPVLAQPAHLHRRGPGNTKSQSDRGRGIREERNT